MRMPINRGIPVTGNQLVVTPPANSSNLYRATVYVRSQDADDPQDAERNVLAPDKDALEELSALEITAGDFTQHTAFDGYPLRSDTMSVTVNPPGSGGIVYGHVEIDDIDRRQPNRPFVNERVQRPFTLPFQIMRLDEPELLVHTLDKNYADLITLNVLVPDDATVQLRFYDGTKLNGVPRYVSFDMVNGTADPISNVFFDRHPMLGPGSIRALVTAASSAQSKAFIYGSVYR